MSEMGIRGVDWEPHHILFENNAWSSNSEALKLRENPALIVPMYVAPHDELHRVVPFVPLLDAFQVFHINSAFKRKDSVPANVRELLRCIEISIEKFDTSPNSTDLNNVLRVQLGVLAIKAIEEQLPHINDGLYRKSTKPKPKQTKVDRRRGGRIC